MKTNRIIMLAALAAATVAFSCTKVENDIENNTTPSGEETVKPAPELVTITAYLPESQDETKVTITESSTYDEAQLAWQENDQITLVDAANGTFVFGIDNNSISGNQAQFTQASPGTIGAAPYTIYYHPSRPLTLDKFNSLGHDGQVQDGNGSTEHLQYGVKLVGVTEYDNIEFSSTWASAHSGTILQNSVMQFLLKLPIASGAPKVYSIYAKDDGDFAQTLWFIDGANLYATPTASGIIKGYMMVPDMDLTGNLTVRVETDKGAYIGSWGLEVTDWVGGAQYTVKKDMTSITPDNTNPMQIHAACAQDILQFKAGVNASIARFTGSTVSLEKNIDMSSAGSWTESITGFTGVFDGNNKTISDLLATAPLFNAIPTGAEVKDFTLGGDFRYSQPNATNDNFGTVTKQLQGGALSGITVVATVSLAAGSNTKLIDFGGLVGRANNASASISNCHFNGSITIPSTYSTSSSIRLGGIVGYTTRALTIQNCTFGGKMECYGGVTGTNVTDPELNIGGIVGRNQKAKVKDCTTYDASSKPKVTINNTDYEASILVQSSKYVFASIGGIVGWNYDGGSISGCTNNSTIFDNITKSGDNLLCVGGIVGFNDCARKLSDNSTSISIASVSESTNNAQTTHLSSPQTQYIGGVVGLDRGNYTGGKNEGAIVVMGSARYPRIGGVIGEKNGGSITLGNGISSTGAVSLSSVEDNAETSPVVGGVFGKLDVAIDGGATWKITNSGNLTVTPGVVTSSTACLGGIVGYSSSNVAGASNSGGLTFNGKFVDSTSATSDACVGGILGYTDSSITVSNCKNNGSAIYQKDSDTRCDGKTSFVGGIVGKMADGGTISSCAHTKRQIRNQNFNNNHEITTGAYCGGIIGALIGTNEHPGSITGVSISSMDDGKYCAYGKRGCNGGVAGYVSYTTINGSLCSGNVYGTNGTAWVSGVVCQMVASTLQNFTYKGNLTSGATANFGGLVYEMDATSEVKDCVFDGTIQNTGGAIAYKATSGAKITHCGVRGTKNSVTITINDSDILGTGTATITDTYAYTGE